MDFRKDDKVWSFRYGNGTVLDINRGSFPIVVEFESGKEADEYTSDGKLYHEDKVRDLYHGHNVVIHIDEHRPKRKISKWVIRYSSGNMSTRCFETEEDAINFNISDENATYHQIEFEK